MVIIKSEMVKNLYKLIGDAILGGAVRETLDNNGRKYIVQV